MSNIKQKEIRTSERRYKRKTKYHALGNEWYQSQISK